jgi:acyl-CoA-binding protein
MSLIQLDQQFNQSVEDVNKLVKRPSNEDLLKLYGFYKQGLFGSNKEQKPNFFNFKSKAKFEAWDKVKTLSKIMAKKEYINLVEELKLTYGFYKNFNY